MQQVSYPSRLGCRNHDGSCTMVCEEMHGARFGSKLWVYHFMLKAYVMLKAYMNPTGTNEPMKSVVLCSESNTETPYKLIIKLQANVIYRPNRVGQNRQNLIIDNVT
ncbi:hypothetical protein V6N11_062875 [Hibiscus sabdariffa]|uniref:Uncharacterized protein n=1 Tax=Hibiscus sabdariffa TaxID=183260 RepID=A0ABR2NPU7_9ROSI